MFAFRVDSSQKVGSGHLMRCLALADYLGARGVSCAFLCRPLPGSLISEIERHGHRVISMSSLAGQEETSESGDARATCEGLAELEIAWLVVDHYGLGVEWERLVKPCSKHLMVIDDCGRNHECNLLLDQNLPNPMHDGYRRNLCEAKLLIGPQFALLRADFGAYRAAARERRTGSLRRVLVSMGGSDPQNATAKALMGLQSAWREGWKVDVIVGANNPHVESVERMSRRLPDATLHVQSSHMAQLMSEADCAIGAGGSMTWERCCLGLPSLVTILSDDQMPIATAVAEAGAQVLVGRDKDVTAADYARELTALSTDRLLAMSAIAETLCDGLGARRVAERML
jgi:UDP-2,4-diacetamido-2,4,6-trideoxy-beta-L-altropyranose hydrolase